MAARRRQKSTEDPHDLEGIWAALGRPSKPSKQPTLVTVEIAEDHPAGELLVELLRRVNEVTKSRDVDNIDWEELQVTFERGFLTMRELRHFEEGGTTSLESGFAKPRTPCSKTSTTCGSRSGRTIRTFEQSSGQASPRRGC
jgi:hypothetical protein